MSKASEGNRGGRAGGGSAGPPKPRADTRAPPRASRREWVLLGGILLAGLIARGLYLREIVNRPDFTHPAVDAGFHDYWARGLATGNWSTPADVTNPRIPETPFFRPPGYPYFLAAIYRLTGHSHLASRVVQMLLGLGNCSLVFAIGRRWFGRGVGLIAAAGMALYWPFVYFEGELHAPPLLIFLLLGSLYLLGMWADRLRLGYALAAGAALGLCTLVRPNAGLLLPAAGVWMAWVARRRGQGKRIIPAAAALVVPAIAVVLPATVRNYVVGEDVVAVSSNAGINLFIGNNKDADGTCTAEIAGLGEFGTCFDYPAIVRNLETKLGRRLKHSEVSAWFAGQAARFIRENPGRFLRLTLKKACLFWGPGEVGHNKEVHYERSASLVLRCLLGGFAMVLALSVVGLSMLVSDRRRDGPDQAPAGAERRWEMSVLLLVAIAVLSVSILPFFVAARYRLPVIPLLLLFAAHAPYGVFRHLAARRPRQAGGWTCLFAALYALALMMPCRYQPSLGKWHYDRGASWLLAKQLDPAKEEFKLALQADRQYARAHYNLGFVLAEQGKVSEAVAHWEAAVRIRPSLPQPHNNLGMALLASGKLDQALEHFRTALRFKPDYALAHNNLGMALARGGKIDQAMRHWNQALEFQPDLPEAHNNLGRALLGAGRIDEGIAHLEAALRINPGYGRAHYNLGRAMLAKSKLPEAAGHFAAAVEGHPDWADAHFQLGQALQLRGEFPQALEHYRRVLQLKGDSVQAMNNLAWLLATCPDPDYRNGPEAVRLAERACKLAPGKPTFLDTLAAAQAEAGQFKKATETIQEALDLAGAAGRKDAVQRMEKRLRLYQQAQPYRQP